MLKNELHEVIDAVLKDEYLKGYRQGLKDAPKSPFENLVSSVEPLKDGKVITVLQKVEIRWEQYAQKRQIKMRGSEGRWVVKSGMSGWIKFNGTILGWFKNEG